VSCSSPATDAEIYGLDVVGASSLSTLVADINAQDPGVASLTFPGGGADPLASQYNVFLDFSGGNLPSGDNYLGFDLTQDSANASATISSVALVPEPTSLGLLASASALLAGRRRNRKA